MAACFYWYGSESLTHHADRVTVYFKDEILPGVRKVECRRVEWGQVAYAQRQSVSAVRFLPKGARKTRQYVETFQPETLIVEGWGHPDPDSMWDESTRTQPTSTTAGSVRAKYRSADTRWFLDLRAKIAQSGARVVADLAEIPVAA